MTKRDKIKFLLDWVVSDKKYSDNDLREKGFTDDEFTPLFKEMFAIGCEKWLEENPEGLNDEAAR